MLLPDTDLNLPILLLPLKQYIIFVRVSPDVWVNWVSHWDETWLMGHHQTCVIPSSRWCVLHCVVYVPSMLLLSPYVLPTLLLASLKQASHKGSRTHLTQNGSSYTEHGQLRTGSELAQLPAKSLLNEMYLNSLSFSKRILFVHVFLSPPIISIGNLLLLPRIDIQTLPHLESFYTHAQCLSASLCASNSHH